MPETLLTDINASLESWWHYYLICNGIMVIVGLVVIILSALTAFGRIPAGWGGGLSAAAGAVLVWLDLGTGSSRFIQARHDLQDARYQFDEDKDVAKLSAAYKKAEDLASWIPSIPSLPSWDIPSLPKKEPAKPPS
jgi:hypothetical protein